MISWAQDSDDFQYIPLQIAISLMGQALGSWKRQPSPKQAKSVIKMINKAEEAEIDMIDMAFEPKKNSRLSCQLIVSDELDGLIVTTPEKQS